MIQQIIAEGYAYEVNGSVYFDVKKYAAGHDYGKLSGRILEDLLETTRVLEGQDLIVPTSPRGISSTTRTQ